MKRVLLLAAVSSALLAATRAARTQQPAPIQKPEARIVLTGTPTPTSLMTWTPPPAPPNHCRVIWSVSLGRLPGCDCAELLKLDEDALTPALYSPSSLYYAPSGSEQAKVGNFVEVIKAADRKSLRQLKVGDTYTDVFTVSEWEYELRFYKQKDVRGKEGGLYAFGGAPFAVWKLGNPDPPAVNRFRITKVVDGVENVGEYFYDQATSVCTLSNDNGASSVWKQTVINPLDPAERTDTFVHHDREGVVKKSVKVYRRFAWGEDLVKLVEDADGEARTTLITYYEDQKDARNYAQERSKVFPDGSWEVYEYIVGGGVIDQRVVRRGRKGSPDQQP